jgi:hypothetical protein
MIFGDYHIGWGLSRIFAIEKDALAKTRKTEFSVMPAHAGIQ